MTIIIYMEEILSVEENLYYSYTRSLPPFNIMPLTF